MKIRNLFRAIKKKKKIALRLFLGFQCHTYFSHRKARFYSYLEEKAKNIQISLFIQSYTTTTPPLTSALMLIFPIGFLPLGIFRSVILAKILWNFNSINSNGSYTLKILFTAFVVPSSLKFLSSHYLDFILKFTHEFLHYLCIVLFQPIL